MEGVSTYMYIRVIRAVSGFSEVDRTASVWRGCNKTRGQPSGHLCGSVLEYGGWESGGCFGFFNNKKIEKN